MRFSKMSNILDIKNLSKNYSSGTEIVKALNNISFSVAQGSFTAIVGKSGSGKTTLLNLIAGFESITEGSIFLDQQNTALFSETQWDLIRNQKIGFIFQNYMLLKEFTALENIMLPYYIGYQNKKTALEKALRLLQFFQMENKKNYYPQQLSGGEAQRIAICRALINHPQLLLADEPTGNLDENNQNLVLEKLEELRKQYSFTLIVVTHSQDIARQADHVFSLHFGSLQS